MTPSELKCKLVEFNPHSHMFDRKTMKFFGDTMRNFGVRSAEVKTFDGTVVECWELYRKRPVNNGLQTSHHFNKITFNHVYNR